MKCYGELLDWMTARLTAAGYADPAVEAVALIAELRDVNRVRAATERNAPLDDAAAQTALAVLARREKHEPWQYIFNRAYFMDLKLYVDCRVLIPRSETESLVERVVADLPDHGTLLDVGTGSGAIALACAFYRPDAAVTACDVSPDALAVAKRNRDALQLTRVELVVSDLFSAFAERRFDVIAANLPYVTTSEYPTLQPEVRDFEPPLALTSGADGLTLIRRAVKLAWKHLNPHGAILFELDPAQAETVAALLAATRVYRAIEIIRDLTGRHRFVCARLA